MPDPSNPQAELTLEVAVAPAPALKLPLAPYAQSPLFPFGLAARAKPEDASCGVWMNELPLLGYIVVRGDAADAAFMSAVRDVLGIDLPTVPGSFVPYTQGVALWQTPDEWLLVCARGSRVAYIGELELALARLQAQVVDSTGGLTMVCLSGAHHGQLLRHVCVYDIDAVTPGRAVSTTFSKAGITLLRHDEQAMFVIFRRSFSDYVWRMLEKAGRPYGVGISQLAFRASHPVLRMLQTPL